MFPHFFVIEKYSNPEIFGMWNYLKNLPYSREFEKIKQKWSENPHLILRSPRVRKVDCPSLLAEKIRIG